ncbi:MAG: hypothetical protein DRG76_01205 [Deltaproteobacteria bacterium]|nr:MAG: hypothetical protein DRG76_01205 [Deltaproteobacteria bacterium]
MPTGFDSDQVDQIERIYGKSLLKFFRQLIDEKTVLRVFLLGKDYERLTIITDLEEKDSEPYIIIDYPAGFKKAIKGTTDWRLRFEFTGNDRLPYVFRTVGGELVEGGIRVRLPKFIERRQRRRNFRLEAPLDTKLVFTKNFRRYEANVINVSLGGVLISLEKGEQKRPVLDIDEYLRGIKLYFPSKEEEERLLIHINEAMVKRVEKDIFHGRYNYALQFTDIDKQDSELLQELIYRFQREYLRKRQLMDT